MPRLRFRVAPSGEPSRSPGQRFAGHHVVDLLRKLLQLARRRHDVDGEPGLPAPDNFAFDPPETVEIGDDALADRYLGRLRVAAARSSSAWAKRSNPYEQCERRRETVSSKHCWRKGPFLVPARRQRGASFA